MQIMYNGAEAQFCLIWHFLYKTRKKGFCLVLRHCFHLKLIVDVKRNLRFIQKVMDYRKFWLTHFFDVEEWLEIRSRDSASTSHYNFSHFIVINIIICLTKIFFMMIWQGINFLNQKKDESSCLIDLWFKIWDKKSISQKSNRVRMFILYNIMKSTSISK